jgi:hypothetical protein
VTTENHLIVVIDRIAWTLCGIAANTTTRHIDGDNGDPTVKQFGVRLSVAMLLASTIEPARGPGRAIIGW